MSEIRTTNGSNKDTSNTLNSVDTELAKNIYLPDFIDTIFQRIDAQDIEQFYKSYHLWSLQQRLKTLHTEIEAMQQAITDNNTLMRQKQPSAIALASLAQLQASGVNNLALLDRMLERGETWLDHTMQLLEHCEELDLIGGDYTEWCEHALEGAYDWIKSINAADTLKTQEDAVEILEASLTTSNEQQMELLAATEEQLLQKLMSDEDITAKIPALSQPLSETEQADIASTLPVKKTTQPLEQYEPEAIQPVSLPTKKITQPLEQSEPEAIQPFSLPTKKITQPLEQGEILAEIEVPETPLPQEQVEIESELLNDQTEDEHKAAPDGAVAETAEGAIALDQPANSSDTLIIPTQEHDTENDTSQTEKLRRLISSQIGETEETDESITQKVVVRHTTIVATSKGADVQEVEDASEEVATSEGTSAQTRVASVEIIESPLESKKPQTRKVRQRGFWRLLRKLLAIILRR